ELKAASARLVTPMSAAMACSTFLCRVGDATRQSRGYTATMSLLSSKIRQSEDSLEVVTNSSRTCRANTICSPQDTPSLRRKVEWHGTPMPARTTGPGRPWQAGSRCWKRKVQQRHNVQSEQVTRRHEIATYPRRWTSYVLRSTHLQTRQRRLETPRTRASCVWTSTQPICLCSAGRTATRATRCR